ncbi:hypothetical protein FF100_36030 [Methylobacterium terricola]|uniref:Uncharacterized protein n=1 Tax=Methylobacterium terricola TaxID=2583531 RepID=A0A5C4L4H2_9HYPH|nr:hypothetical protein [Methylobacterium terricola]TNC05221.1 hypothetical protein FF100_36030 [Methylobacterium terricola]
MMSVTQPGHKRKTLGGSFLAGLGALASIWPAAPVASRYPHRSDLEALRGDRQRIGADMRRVIDRERARVQASKTR